MSLIPTKRAQRLLRRIIAGAELTERDVRDARVALAELKGLSQPSKLPLGPRASQLLRLIAASFESQGMAPTYAELQASTGLALSTIYEAIEGLVKRGLIRRTSAGGKRNLTITQRGVRALRPTPESK